MPADVPFIRAAAVAVALATGLAACGAASHAPPLKTGSLPPAVPRPAPPPPTNRAPTADAGADLVTTAGQPVRLTAAASTDPDGDALSYSWNIVAGTGGGLTQPDRADAGFQATLPGTYIVEVTVRDSANLTGTDITVVDVQAARAADAHRPDPRLASVVDTNAPTRVTTAYAWSFAVAPKE